MMNCFMISKCPLKPSARRDCGETCAFFKTRAQQAAIEEKCRARLAKVRPDLTYQSRLEKDDDFRY